MNMETMERMSSGDWAISFAALLLCLQFVLLTSFSYLAKMLRICFSITRKWWVNDFAKIRMHSKVSLARYQSAWDGREKEMKHTNSITYPHPLPWILLLMKIKRSVPQKKNWHQFDCTEVRCYSWKFSLRPQTPHVLIGSPNYTCATCYMFFIL